MVLFWKLGQHVAKPYRIFVDSNCDAGNINQIDTHQAIALDIIDSYLGVETVKK